MQHKRIRLDFPNRSTLIHVRNGTRAITRALSHLGECPWRLSVPKLTVRVRFPSPAQHAKSVAVEPLWRNPVPCRSVFPVHARATLGHRYPHPGTHPQASEDAQLVPSCSPAVRFSGSSKVTQGVSPQVRARCERAQLQRREETRQVIPRARWRVRRRSARPVDHPLPDARRSQPASSERTHLPLTTYNCCNRSFAWSR